MSNKYIVPIGVLIAAVLISVGGFLILNPYQPGSPDNAPDNDSYVEPSEGEAHSFMPELKVTEDASKQNADVPLKVGKKYEYKTTMQNTYEDMECKTKESEEEYYRRMQMYYSGMDEKGNNNLTQPELPPGCERKNKTTTTSSTTEYNVEKTERAEGKDCYVVSVKPKQDMEEIKKSIREYKSDASEEEIEKMAEQQKAMAEQQTTTYYYDKENGKIIKIVMKMGNTEMTYTEDLANVMSTMMGMYMGFPVLSQWMLALDENFRWIQTIEEKGGEKHKAEIEYKFVETEKANNRECFKVEITLKDKSSVKSEGYSSMDMKTIVWIDKEKRILVKSQTKAEGLMTSETNLIPES
ncbi:MAG: hypothetical protein CVT88_07080 [Candidatus Altiarchaeales archaeon HGW-Altiarchaeales-1]|nr:MAG: hypothetical protein CVT88_07080 [Candidatus Altiarchaeales archaeon HGW-Altiarchaeales-1]